MGLSLGKIVKSNAHTDYVCQIYAMNEVAAVPQSSSYALGTFVSIDLGEPWTGFLVGLIYDTVLLNPDFGRLGPRLSSETELTMFAPDYLNERAVLVGVTAIGRITSRGRVFQGVPRLAANNDAQVIQMEDEQIRDFHLEGETLNLVYLPMLLEQDNPLAYHLARIVLERLTELMPDYHTELAVLDDDLTWRTQIGPMGGI